MVSRERRLARAAWLIRRDVQEVGTDLRNARLAAGLTLREVAAAAGSSKSAVLRREQGVGRESDALARQAAAVGMRARVRIYPDGDPVRDAAQVRLLRDVCARLHPSIAVALEPPVISTPGSGDRRAFDAILSLPGCQCGVECYTRFHDCQAQLRSALSKQRDSGVGRLLVVVRSTHANRRAVAFAADLIATTLPLGTRSVLAALAQGRDPGANGLIFV